MVNFIKTDGTATVQVSVEVHLIQQGDYIVSYCPALELSSFGVTEQAAKDGFEGALRSFLSDTQQKGPLEKVLLDLGWSLQKRPTAKYRPPIKREDNKSLNSSFIRTIKERVQIPV